MWVIVVIGRLRELFHSNIAYHAMRYLGPHHLAGIMKPQSSNKGPFNVLGYDICKYHTSRHCESELSSQYWDLNVIEDIIKSKLQIRYLTSDGLTELDPPFHHMNKEAIDEIIRSDEFGIIEDQYD